MKILLFVWKYTLCTLTWYKVTKYGNSANAGKRNAFEMKKKNISANSPEKLLSNKMFETSKLYSFYKILYVQQKIQGKLVDY